MKRIGVIICLAAVACLAWPTCRAADSPEASAGPVGEMPPLIFEGLGLEGFSGARSVAAALRQAGADRDPDADSAGLPLAVAVRGPSGSPSGREPVPLPLAAEVRSRIERFDIAAGLKADPSVIEQGPAGWTGRIGVSTERAAGSESFEVRTVVGRQGQTGMLRVEVGPRIERQLRRGTRFFIDGKAEAQAVRSRDSGWWAMPGTTTADGPGAVGVMARTGLIR